MKVLQYVLATTCLISAWSAQAGGLVETKREMLSTHETVAEFEGVAYRQCMGMTAMCPDKCGNSGDFATFKIVSYIAYEKPGKYGDAKQEKYTFQVEDNMKNLKVSREVYETLNALKEGDTVLFEWRHDYVTKNGSSGPERVVIKLEKITAGEASALTGIK